MYYPYFQSDEKIMKKLQIILDCIKSNTKKILDCIKNNKFSGLKHGSNVF